MGQQQILSLVLGICIFGIAVSVGMITLQNATDPDNREVLIRELQVLSAEAQAFYKRPIEEDGGEGSFIGLTAGVEGMRKLTAMQSTIHGDYFIRKDGDLNSVELMAIGTRKGNDPRLPVRIVMTVMPESSAIQVLN